MAIDLNAVRFLALAKQEGVSFDRVLMFGRQNLAVSPHEIKKILEPYGISTNGLIAALENEPQPPFAEPIFQTLGAKQVSSVDASPYQKAEFIHDMNLPVSNSMKGRFDVVYDGGSLEHVFNVIVALKNCMEMVKPGGRLFLQTPANNWFGHGFYQFSPEFFYRALSDENGFEIEHMIAHRTGPHGSWHAVVDLKNVGGNAGHLLTLYPVLLLVRARKVRETEIFARMPQQSLYTATWNKISGGQKQKAIAVWAERLKSILPEMVRFQFLRRHGFTNRKCFKSIKK